MICTKLQMKLFAVLFEASREKGQCVVGFGWLRMFMDDMKKAVKPLVQGKLNSQLSFLRLQQVREVAVDRVQEFLACLLALDSGDLEEAVQFILCLWYLINDLQLLWTQDGQQVIKDGLQVTGVQADLAQNGVFLFCIRQRVETLFGKLG